LCTTAGVRRVAMTDQESVTDSGLDVVRMLDQFADVASFLDSLVRWAVAQTPGAEACGLTVEQAGRGRTVTYSGELAARGDERQYELDDGPCLQALRSGEVVTVADMAQERRWGRYPRRALDAGVRSSLSLPLTVGDRGRGALNLYASSAHAFTETDERAGQSWAGQASGALSVAWQMAERAETVGHLSRGMVTRQVIGQAVGLLMAQRSCTADEAFQLLKETSQRTNEKLRDIAERLVTAHEDGVHSSR
jgi:hypothetical protein